MDTKQLLEAVETIRIIKSLFGPQPNAWLPVIAAVSGALVGGFATIIPTFLIELKKRKDERNTVTCALIAEIRAMLTIIRLRRYVEGLQTISDQLRATPGSLIRYRVKVPDHYSRVYQANVVNIGIVEPRLAARIIEFHQLVDAVVQDIAPGGLVAEQGGNFEAFENILTLVNSALTIGSELIEGFDLGLSKR